MENMFLLLYCFTVFFCQSRVKVIVHAISLDGPLNIQNGETLTINTTSLKAQITRVGSPGQELTLQQRNVSCSGSTIAYSDVAVLNITKDITLNVGSKINIFGHRALSIVSMLGSIKINTDLNMTCSSPIGYQTCLGGYIYKKDQGECNTDSFNFYPGYGPGWKFGVGDYVACKHFTDACFPGGSHGGQGGTQITYWTPIDNVMKEYNTSDYQCMHGGSAGYSKRKNLCFSGGAIEIKARKTIHIGGTISASGFAPNSSAPFAGCSGGLIRLIATEVEMQPSAFLIVNGTSGGSTLIGKERYDAHGNGGGGGGVVQIMASKGNISSIALDGGKSYICAFKRTNKEAENGVLIVKSNKTYEQSFSQGWVSWQDPSYVSPSEPTPGPNGSIVYLNMVSEDLVAFKAKLKEGMTGAEIEKLIIILEQLKKLTVGKLTTDELYQIFGIFENSTEILSFLSKQTTLTKVQEIFNAILEISTSLIAEQNLVNWKTIRQLPVFAGTLERMALSATNSTNSSSVYSFNTTSIVVQSYHLRWPKQDGYRFPEFNELPSKSFITYKDYVYIPKSALEKNDEGYRMVMVFFKDVQAGLPERNSTVQSKGSRGEPFKVASMMVSCSLYFLGEPVKNLSTPVSLHFGLVTDEENTKNMQAQARCVYWDNTRSSWASDGVTVEHFNSTRAICKTLHFTSFAVLVQHTPITLTKAEELSLLLITYIGCGISTAALLISMIVFLSIEALSSDRHRIHLNLVIALLLAQILFLTGISATSHKTLCKVIAGGLHYFYLVSFTWMLIEGVHLYLKVVKVFGIENIKILQYYILGWGVPALIVGAAAVIKPYGYGTKYVCWLSMDDGFVWAFIGPILGIIAINCFILVAVIKTVVASASTMKSSDHSHIKAGIKGALVLMPLMGITWIFGLLAVNRESIVFQYIFSIANSLQGTLIFLLHIVFNNEVRQAFKRQREKKQLSKESGDYNASVSNTHDNGGKAWGKSTSSNSLTGRIKARLSMSMMPRTSRVISVQPLKNNEDEDVQIDRKYCHSNPATGLSTSLHCPAGNELDSKPPMHSPLKSGKNKSENRL